MTHTAAYHYTKVHNYDKIFNSCFGGLVTSITAYHYIKIVEVLGGFSDVHRSLPLRQDLQLLGGLVTPTAAYHYIKILNSWEAS